MQENQINVIKNLFNYPKSSYVRKPLKSYSFFTVIQIFTQIRSFQWFPNTLKSRSSRVGDVMCKIESSGNRFSGTYITIRTIRVYSDVIEAEVVFLFYVLTSGQNYTLTGPVLFLKRVFFDMLCLMRG